MSEDKGERRERQRHRSQYGMKVSNRSIMVLLAVIGKGKKKRK